MHSVEVNAALEVAKNVDLTDVKYRTSRILLPAQRQERPALRPSPEAGIDVVKVRRNPRDDLSAISIDLYDQRNYVVSSSRGIRIAIKREVYGALYAELTMQAGSRIVLLPSSP